MATSTNSYTQRKREIIRRWERKFLMRILSRCGGNRSYAAEEIGLNRGNFVRLLRKHGLMEFEK